MIQHVQLRRIEPVGTPDRYKTYQIVAPIKTHFRPAKSCEEVDCGYWRNGWDTIIDESTPEGQYRTEIIKNDAKHYSYTVERNGPLVTYHFAPGQNCFKLRDHRVRLDRPQRHFVRSGDYRGLGRAVELRAEDWQEDFEVHQDRINTRLERG